MRLTISYQVIKRYWTLTCNFHRKGIKWIHDFPAFYLMTLTGIKICMVWGVPQKWEELQLATWCKLGFGAPRHLEKNKPVIIPVNDGLHILWENLPFITWKANPGFTCDLVPPKPPSTAIVLLLQKPERTTTGKPSFWSHQIHHCPFRRCFIISVSSDSAKPGKVQTSEVRK